MASGRNPRYHPENFLDGVYQGSQSGSGSSPFGGTFGGGFGGGSGTATPPTSGGGGTTTGGAPITATAFGGGDTDWIKRLLDEDQGLAYNTFLNQQNLPVGIERFMRSRSPNVQADFGADLGRQIAAGTIPNTSFFNEWLPNKFNIQEYLSRFSPRSKGLGTGQFDPRTQYGF